MQEKSRCQLWNFFHNTAIKSRFILSGLLGGGPTKAKAKILPGSNVIQGNYDHYAAIRWSSTDPEHHTATSDQNSAKASSCPARCVWGTRRSQKVTLLVALNFYAPLRHAMADACTDLAQTLARVLYSAPILPPATRDRAHSTDHGARNTARTTSVSRYVAPPQAIAGVGVIAVTRSRRRMSSPVAAAGPSPVPHVGCASSPGNDRGVGGAALEAASALSTRCTSARSTLPQPEPQPGDRLRAGRACTSATRGNAV